jgi:hypothetical protein
MLVTSIERDGADGPGSLATDKVSVVDRACRLERPAEATKALTPCRIADGVPPIIA